MEDKNVEFYTLEPILGMKNSQCDDTDNVPYISLEMRRRALEGGLFTKTHNNNYGGLTWFDIQDMKTYRIYTVVNKFIQKAPKHLVVAARLRGEI